MKRIILTYGIIGGIIVATLMLLNIASGIDWENGYLKGYTIMVIALSTMFFGVRTYRDKHLAGSITFGKAFLMGLYITLVASTLYVASWMVYSSVSKQDYMQEYYEHEKARLEKSELTEAEVDAELKDIRDFQESYKNPLVKMGATYAEILPVGLLISLICAALLKRESSAPVL